MTARGDVTNRRLLGKGIRCFSKLPPADDSQEESVRLGNLVDHADGAENAEAETEQAEQVWHGMGWWWFFSSRTGVRSDCPETNPVIEIPAPHRLAKV